MRLPATISSGSTCSRSCCRRSSARGWSSIAACAAALLALPLVALGGYAIIAAGVGLSVVRWIKTVENATDYSIMNTARQLLWLPTNREEKYKAKQAIDAFFMRGGDLLSAVVVYVGSRMLHLTVEQFAIANIALTLVWIGVALAILGPRKSSPRPALRPACHRRAGARRSLPSPRSAFAQETREEERAALQAQKAAQLRPYEPTQLERRIERIGNLLDAQEAPDLSVHRKRVVGRRTGVRRRCTRRASATRAGSTPTPRGR